MAQKKSKADIIKSQKYMDDAVSSAFFNLHKALKRKSEYIWATHKFNSLDSIWGDSAEPESDEVMDKNKVIKNPKYESKILKQQYCGERNLAEVIVPDNARKTGLHQEQTIKIPTSPKAPSDTIWGDPVVVESDEVLDDTSKVNKNPKLLKQQYCGVDNKQSTTQVHECNPVEVIISDNARKTRVHLQQPAKSSASRKASLLKNFDDRNEEKRNKSKYLNPASNVLNADEHESRIKLESPKRNPDVDCRISDTRYEWSQKISQKKQNFKSMETLKTRDHSQYNFGGTGKTQNLTSFENCRFNLASNVEKNEGAKLHKDETQFQTDCIKTKLDYSDTPRKERAIERVKRKRHMSSSVNSLLPEQKHFSIENHDTADKRRIMLKTMLELKICQGDKIFDFTIELSDFNRMRKRFPKLEEVLPGIDGDDKELNYSADAVKIVLGFLRNVRYPTPDGRTAVEVLAASKCWEMYPFHDEFKQKFSENLNKNNTHLAYGAAVHYGLGEICDAYKCALGDDLPSNNRPYRPRKCCVSVTTYIEPREFCIPSKISTPTLNDNFDRDIKNEIRFKAIAGSYVITGFHILLDIGNNETDSINLEFFYVIKNFKSSYKEELKVRKPLRPNIVIHLKRSLVVNQDETAEIVVESTIKPILCFSIKETNFVRRCDESHFSLNVTSNYKVKDSNEKRFMIGKLLYYPKT